MVVGTSVARPWPKVPVGNKDHTQAAVVIIGAGISGMFGTSEAHLCRCS